VRSGMHTKKSGVGSSKIRVTRLESKELSKLQI
jgi:hypothetical protein